MKRKCWTFTWKRPPHPDQLEGPFFDFDEAVQMHADMARLNVCSELEEGEAEEVGLIVSRGQFTKANTDTPSVKPRTSN